jgi:hypothetical protein
MIPELLGDEVAVRGAQGEGEQHREPIERFPPHGGDAVNRQRVLDQIPDHEHRDERHSEEGGRRLQWNSEVVGEVVGDQRADDADEDYRQPVHGGNVATQAELGRHHDSQQARHGPRRVGEAETEVHVDGVSGGLCDRRRQDLDHPQEDGDLGNLAQGLSIELPLRGLPTVRCENGKTVDCISASSQRDGVIVGA